MSMKKPKHFIPMDSKKFEYSSRKSYLYEFGFSKILLSLDSAIFLSLILITEGSNDAQTVALQFLVLQTNVKLFELTLAIR